MRNGYGRDGKKHAEKLDKAPVRIVGDCLFEAPEEYASLFPEGSDTPFTAPELAKQLHMRPIYGYSAVKVFLLSGCIREAGKRGKATEYKRV